MTISKYQQKYIRKTIKRIKRNDPSTTEVVLTDYDLSSDDTLASLVMSLMGNNHVKILYLQGCNITAKGAYLIAFALRSNRSIEHLWLNDNKIGSTGADALASILFFNNTILTLGLRNNSIGNRGGKALLRAVNENCKIVGISLEGNRMSSMIVNEINRITATEPSHYESDDAFLGYEHDDVHVYDEETVTNSVVSKSYAARVLGAIKETTKNSDNFEVVDDTVISGEIDSSPSSCSNKKEREGKFAKLKQMTIGRLRKKRVRPSPLP